MRTAIPEAALTGGYKAGGPVEVLAWLADALDGVDLTVDERDLFKVGAIINALGDGGRLGGEIATVIVKARRTEAVRVRQAERQKAAAEQIGDVAVATIRAQVRAEIEDQTRARVEAEVQAEAAARWAVIAAERAELSRSWQVITSSLRNPTASTPGS